MNWRSVSPWGLVIALVGFLLTRTTVTLAADGSTMQFLFAGVVPLILGLSLAAFGVILMVGAYNRKLVRTTALWSLVGTGGMAVLVGLTLLGSQGELTTMSDLRQRTYLSNFLIGGAVGGTLTGLYAARNRRHRRHLRQQANRLILLNRLLRDKVINSATAIKGHADMLSERHREGSVEVVDEQADSVIETVENVKYLAETADTGQSLGSVDVVDCLDNVFEAVRDRFPDAEFDCETPDEEIRVRATAQLSEVFRHLLTNAAQYSDGRGRVSAAVDSGPNHVTVRITDDGRGLPADQRALLEAGEIAEFDDPTTGFGLNIVRLLVESFDGQIETAVDEAGTTVSIRLPRERAAAGATRRTITAPGVSPPRVALAVGASLIAGVVMGAGMVATGGDVPIIGALYGVENPVVAVISHEFHSVVFGLVYAGLLSTLSAGSVGQFRTQMTIAVGLGLALWFFAAGLVMPLWLSLLGIDTAVPMLTVPALVGHLLWALSLGTVYYYGDRWLADEAALDGRYARLDRLSQRILGE